MNNTYQYIWTLKDAQFDKNKGKVFSCFACGGGSTMGYKLAGFDVVGCNEIDPRMNKLYVANHHPRINCLCDIREMVNMELPRELYNLDILDGSPPCSSFSMAGIREQGWGKEKKFREGQSKQVLDTLFFDFISIAKKLRPKVVISENVKGIMLGSAIKYVRDIYNAFSDAGYVTTHSLCDASMMGVPQKRERVFFIAIRQDLFDHIPHDSDLFYTYPHIDLKFNEQPIKYGEFCDNEGRDIKGKMYELWQNRKNGDTCMGDACKRIHGKASFFSQSYIYKDDIIPTLTSHEDSLIPFDKPKYTSKHEVCCMSSFPQDYDFGNEKPHYVCGMSVPPIMMAQIASRVYDQWLSKINESHVSSHVGGNKHKEPIQLSLFS